MKPIVFAGDSLDVIRRFPEGIRQSVGYQLDRVQRGLEPNDWKPMNSIGGGVREIRLRDESGAYRTIYLATFGDAIHVLHAFQKKSQKTLQRDLEIARRRLSALLRGAAP
jgi:phage-related protein